MGKTEIIISLITSTLVFAILVAGILSFIIQYRKRKLEHTRETALLHKQHTQELLEKQIDTQQQTMQHIGREIHDNVGQKLTLASLYLKQFSASQNEHHEQANAIGNIIDESLADLRQLSKSLTNPQFAGADILALLREEAKRINASGVCYVRIVAAQNEMQLPPSTKNVLFRLLQEFIQNSLKHAACKTIEIHFAQQNNRLTVSAKDDGKGFDTTVASKGIGLYNMKRRAEELQATFELQSQPGKGTKAVIVMNNG